MQEPAPKLDYATTTIDDRRFSVACLVAGMTFCFFTSIYLFGTLTLLLMLVLPPVVSAFSSATIACLLLIWAALDTERNAVSRGFLLGALLTAPVPLVMCFAVLFWRVY